ncbi:LytTR family DNA-binding domain-containing protein [Undibacterium sp.]|uniref:LytR/AlgR family response regulator transcription factor n=1 Tax=Undibacterium sp. TaxID=1914977 RepID=UPI002B53E972|nr:LytTR family DNA-binding domain-containing protein [Undibacterium sp.]HTD02702.1 LytTR family DNA-binding domain-containing protein [Undibacterium sp.]
MNPDHSTPIPGEAQAGAQLPTPEPVRRDLLARYQPWRKIVEPGFWIVLLCFQASVNSVVAWLDMRRAGLGFAIWEPVVWEVTSNLAVLALIPAVLAFERRYPLQLATWRRHWPLHLLASLAFCVLHVAAMVAGRKLAYFLAGSSYDFGNWMRETGYEYLKDVRAYVGILAAVALYRLLLLRLQGEARLLAAPESGPPVEPIERPERFLVRKLGKEFLLPAAEVEWLQAWGNYVNLRVRAHDYPLRCTMAAIEGRLDGSRFVRVHRSYIVNLDYVREIVPLDSGDARATMRDGSQLPISRRYRDSLRKMSAWAA